MRVEIGRWSFELTRGFLHVQALGWSVYWSWHPNPAHRDWIVELLPMVSR
ncbi:MAG: hypothetical protein ACT4NL_08095 [Pseudomarimonas sp.]